MSSYLPEFFRLLLSNCLNWKIYCDDHSSHSPFCLYCSPINFLPLAGSKIILKFFHLFWMKAVKVKYKLNLKEENRRKPTYYHVSCSPSISPLVYRKICTDEYYPSGYFPRVGILGILVPIALFSSLSRRGLGTRIEELWRHRIFQVLDSRTSVLHECRHDVSIYCMRL